MTVGTNANSLRTPRRKITINTKENTSLKKNSKSNVSSKNFNKKDVKENVFSKQMVSKMKTKSFTRVSNKQIVPKTKTESGMLKKNHSVGPKIDTTRVPRFVDMSTIKSKPTRRRRIVSNYPSTTLSVKKAKAATLLLDQEGMTPYNKFSTCYGDLLKIPPTTCSRPFVQKNDILLNEQFTPSQICPPRQQSEANNFTIDTVAPPNSLTNFTYLKEDVTDCSTSISTNDKNSCDITQDEDMLNTACEVSSLSTDSMNSIAVTLDDVTPKTFVEEPKLRKSDYEDENREKCPIWEGAANFHYNNIKEDQQTDYLSTASSSIIDNVRLHDVGTNSFFEKPKLGKFGYEDGNKKEGQHTDYLSTASSCIINVKLHDVTPDSSVEGHKLGKFGYEDRNRKNYRKFPNFHYNDIKEDENVGSSDSTEGILEEISIEEDCSARRKKSESVVNAKIFNDKVRLAKIISPYTKYRKRFQMKPCLESVKENLQLEQNLLEIGDGCHNVESQKLININSYCTMDHTKAESHLESQKGTDFIYCNTPHCADVERPKFCSQSQNNTNTETSNTMAYPKGNTKTESYSDDQERKKFNTNNTLAYPKNVRRTDSCIQSQKGTNIETNNTMAYAKENSRTESSDSLKLADFVCNTMHYSAEGDRSKSRSEKRKRISIETSNTIAYPKEIRKTESYTEDQERMNFKTNDTLAYPKKVERTDAYMESQKETYAKENRRTESSNSLKMADIVCNTMYYTAVGERPKSTPDKQNRTNVTSYPKEASKVEFFSDSQEDSYIEMNNTLTYPKSARRAGSYLKSRRRRRMIDTNNTMSYPKGIRIVKSKRRIQYQTNNTRSYTKAVGRAADNQNNTNSVYNNTMHYNTEVGRSKSYLQSQNRATVGTSNTMVYPKESERGELYSDCQERINSVYNNSGHNTTEVEKPKSCPEGQKRIDVETNNTMVYPKKASKMESFSDLLHRLSSLYANITHCMTGFESAKSCLEYQKMTNGATNSTIASKEVEKVEFYSKIQNRLNMIYGNIKYFTIELKEMKSCLECQKSLYIETSNTMAHLKNVTRNEKISSFEIDKTLKYAKQVEIAETYSDIEDTISFETDEIIEYYADEVEQSESLSEIELSSSTTETCSSEDVALVQSCSSMTVSTDTSSCSKSSIYNIEHLKFLLKLHSTLSGFLHQYAGRPL